LPAAWYWAFLFIVDRLEWPTFARFASRLVCGLLLALFTIIWWWVNRRTSFRERAAGFLAFIVGGIVVIPLCDESNGLAGPGLLMGSLSVVLTAWVLAAFLTRRSSATVRTLGVAAALSCAWISLALVRLEGLSGELRPELHWRWTPTAEDAFRAERGQTATIVDAKSAKTNRAPIAEKAGDWTGFRGSKRDATVHGTSIRTDWDATPPRQVWSHRVGPAWSSVVVVDRYVFTQEQRDQLESAVCYAADTGDELWSNGDEARFTEPTAGPGPRATPCFASGRLFTLGCTGILNCFEAATGKRLWLHDLATEYGGTIPHWGYTSSPLVVGDRVIAYAAGPDGKNLVAFDTRSGELQWAAAAGETSYASPQLVTVAGKPQVLMVTNRGVTAVDPATGQVSWEYLDLITKEAPRSVQPASGADSSILMGSEAALVCFDVAQKGDAWNVSKRWESKSLKPAFNDYVVTQASIFGFDGRIFACADAETGARRWKDGRYGEGQVLLLADQGLLLVLSERGEVILLRANPDRLDPLGRFQGIHGKTWTHPALVRGKLYLRNAEEMACYDPSANNAN
jgi:outer membrane protein assembly factor BamB